MNLEDVFHLVMIVSVVVVTGVVVMIGYQLLQIFRIVKQIGYEMEHWAANFSKMQYAAKAGVWGTVGSLLRRFGGGEQYE